MLGLGLAPVLAIMMAPVHIGSVAFSINTQMIGSALTLLGFQLIGFGVFTKAFAEIEGLMPKRSRTVAFVYSFSLEFGILLGLVGIMTGFGIIAWAIIIWQEANFGELSMNVIRAMIPATLIIMLSVQLIFSRFVLDVLRLRRRRSESP